MDKNKLRNIIQADNINSNFIYDELVMTWQISYVRFVCGEKSNFKGIEDFYWNLMRCNKYVNQICFLNNKQKWYKSIDKIVWLNCLYIEEVDAKLISEEIEEALIEIKEEEHNHEKKYKINHNIKFPRKVLKCWNVRETKQSRLQYGLTWSLIAECENEYFYIERHWES